MHKPVILPARPLPLTLSPASTSCLYLWALGGGAGTMQTLRAPQFVQHRLAAGRRARLASSQRHVTRAQVRTAAAAPLDADHSHEG